jgi:hypothetical protein
VVSLAERSEYLHQFGSDHYARAFIDFLMGSKVSAREPSSGETANDLGVMAFRAIQENDRARFDEAYERISGRRPSPESDWLYNDLLLFALAVGVVKFGSDADWLVDALRTRANSTEGESQLIARTLSDAVNGNFESTNNHGPLLIVVKHILDMPLGSPEYVNSIFRQLVLGPFPPHESSFLNVISLRAADAIVLSKDLGDLERRLATDRFLASFEVRIEQVASVLWVVLTVVAIAATAYFGYRYLNAPKQERGTFETILALLPLLGLPGVGVLGLFWKRRQIEAWLKRRLLRFFGHPAQA